MARESENAVLDEAKLVDALIELPGWERKGNQIVKAYKFDSFPRAMEFVNAVANKAEELKHHPDIHINFTKVKVFCWTHKFNAVTQADVELATAVEKVYEEV